MNYKIGLFILAVSSIYNIAVAQKSFSVDGTLFGRQIQTNVDNELAKTMLTKPEDSDALQLFSEYSTRENSTETLYEITQKYSVDVASLFFVEKLYSQVKNRCAQNYYLSAIDTISAVQNVRQLSFLQNYYIVFVPGLMYKNAKNGSNFLNQRRLLDSIGIRNEMINIDEIGFVEDNAEIIAHRLRELSIYHDNIILVSVSKGSLETAIALEKISNHQEFSFVKAWVNVGGILRGTPIADYWAPLYHRTWMSCGLFFIGKRIELKAILFNLSYKRCKEKYKTFKIPAEITVVNLIGVPLGRQKKPKIYAPNDGFSPLPDAIFEEGIVIIEPGVDHFFKGIDLNKRMIAILYYINELLCI